MKRLQRRSSLGRVLSRVANSKGKVYYGLHFYPGVAEYRPDGEDPYRVYLSEDTLRRMDPTFAGRPVYVLHVDGVPASVDDIRGEADGWVIESFFNKADGKHWAKFLVCSERGEKAVADGFRLSNCYEPQAFGASGIWNGVDYDKEVTAGEYEHLALVPDPRYEESVVMTPEEFKAYNAEKENELVRLANNKEDTMPIKLFRKTAVTKLENAKDLDEVMVELKSGRQLTLTQLVNAMDDYELKAKNAGDEMLVNMGEGKDAMTVADLRNKYNEACAMIDEAKKKNAESETDEDEESEDDTVENDAEDGDEDETVENDAEDGDADEDDEEPAKKKKNAADGKPGATSGKKPDAKARERAEALRNASSATAPKPDAPVIRDPVSVGRSRYGS